MTILICPYCNSESITTAQEDMFMVNTGQFHCHSVKIQDPEAKATCLNCGWSGTRQKLLESPK